METIEVSTNKMEDTEWDLWQLLLTQEDGWVKSVTDGTNVFLEEVGFQHRSVEHFVSLQQLSISWVWDIKFGSNTSGSISSDSAFKIFIESLSQISMTKNSLLDVVHLDVNSIETHFKVDQLGLLGDVSIQVSVKVLEVFVPLIHEVVSKLGC